MLVVHRLVWVNVTTHVVGTNDIGVTHLLRRLDCGRRRWPETDSRLRTRSTRCKEHERNEREVFHGWRVTRRSPRHCGNRPNARFQRLLHLAHVEYRLGRTDEPSTFQRRDFGAPRPDPGATGTAPGDIRADQ